MPGGNTSQDLDSIQRILTWSTEINVAYDGTSADLGSADIQNLSWEQLCESPLMPNFTAINNDSNMGTVSPKDLLMDSSASGSVPSSAAYTNLTTPGSGYLQTPSDSYDTSPMFDSLDAPEVWPSLFSHEETAAFTGSDMPRSVSASSQVVIHPGGLSRKRSSNTASPFIDNVRPSVVAGINKREKPLAPIVVDPNDITAVKRARNTAAARKSRDKKFKETEAFKARIAELEEELEHWKSIALAAGKS